MRYAARSKKGTESVGAIHGNYKSAPNKQSKKYKHKRRAYETKLFAYNRKNKVILRCRNVKIFLTGISETRSPQPAGTYCDKRLYGLISLAFCIGIRVHPHCNTVCCIFHKDGTISIIKTAAAPAATSIPK